MKIKKIIILFATGLLCTACSSAPKVKPIEATLPETNLVEYGDDLATRVSTDSAVSVSYIIKDIEGNEKKYIPDEIELEKNYQIVYTLTRESETKTVEETIQFQDTTPPTVKFLGENNTITLSTPLNYDTIYDEISSYYEMSDNYKVNIQIDLDSYYVSSEKTLSAEIRANDGSNKYVTLPLTIIVPEK